MASEVFLADQDGFLGNWGMNNFFLYRPEFSNQFRLIVWDKSQAFVDGPAYPIWHNITDVPEANRNRLMSRALEYRRSPRRCIWTRCSRPDGRRARCRSTRCPAIMRGWLEREIDRAYALIAPSVLADTLKPYTNEEFSAVDRGASCLRARTHGVRQRRGRGVTADAVGRRLRSTVRPTKAEARALARAVPSGARR